MISWLQKFGPVTLNYLFKQIPVIILDGEIFKRFMLNIIDILEYNLTKNINFDLICVYCHLLQKYCFNDYLDSDVEQQDDEIFDRFDSFMNILTEKCESLFHLFDSNSSILRFLRSDKVFWKKEIILIFFCLWIFVNIFFFSQFFCLTI